MPKKHALRKSNQSAIVKLSFLLLFSIPFIVLGLSSNETFDTRKKAFEELELSEANPCLISLPSVNPYSLEVGKTVRVSVDARITNDYIDGIQITDSTGTNIYRESFSDNQTEIATTFEFTPQTSGMIDMLGVLTKESGQSVACKISSPYDIKGIRAIANNSSPQFTSTPSDSQPSQNIKVGQNYEYTLTATDGDKDRINYSYSFTPRADWLKEVVLEDGANGSLKIKFKGTPDKPASYLAYVLIHDGYSSHVSTQSWIISAGQNENDIPKIKITDPATSMRINQGETFKASWQATDLNHISQYNLFMTNNPADESKWIPIEKNLPYNTNRYSITTQKLTPGTYNLLVQATDNQTPAKTGLGVSPEIIISKVSGSSGSSDNDNQDTVDDQVIISQPQITNMSPSTTDKITYFKPTIKATIIASDNEKINQDTILFKINNKDVSKSIKINRVSDKEFTLIYQPDENLAEGEQKVEISFEDTAKKTVSKSWTFSITPDESITQSSELNIFGYTISKKTITIIVTGIAIVTLAIISPFIISSIWKKDNKLGEDAVFLSNKVVKTVPTDTEMFIMSNTDREEVRQKVENTPDASSTETIKETDKWDNFSAPLLEENEANKSDESTVIPAETELQKEQPHIEENILENENIPPVEDSITQTDDTYSNPDIPVATETDVTTIPQAEIENIAEETSTSTERLIPIDDNSVEQTETYIPQTSLDTVVETVSTSSETQISDDEILQTIPDAPLPPVTQPEISAPIAQPTDQEILQTIPDMPQPPVVENIPQQMEESIQQPTIEQPVQPIESIPPLPEQTSPQQEQPVEDLQQNIQIPTIEQQQPTTTPDAVIPEPEAPAPEDLQKIFEQIQQTEN